MTATTPAVKDAYSTGHGCFPPTQLVQASDNVFAGGKGVGRLDDQYASHSCDSTTHSGSDRKIVSGSDTVFVNGKKCGKLGSDVADGDAVGNHGLPEGAKKVYIGG